MNRHQGQHLIMTRQEFWDRERENTRLCQQWEACQSDPCLVHPHGPSTECRRTPEQRSEG